ncbi:response regulator [Euzebya sp.]|uniref:response regulator n=1 Tax=Euzebya sp. TaxID=1971409 RepID=UPI003513F3EC
MTEQTPRRCLLVDDDDAMRMLVRLHLEGVDADVVTAASVPAGCELVDAEDPSFAMVVADHRMPGTADGVDLLRHARDRDPATRLVLLSSHFAPETVAAAEALGATVVDKADADRVARLWAAADDGGGPTGPGP